ncbi:MAG: BON domain-containing protein [Pirellulales bacterium]
MSSTLIVHSTDADRALAERVWEHLRHNHVLSLRRVRVDAAEGTVILRGEVSSFYARQLLLHGARRAAGQARVSDELTVVTPESFRDPLRLRRSAAAGLALLLVALLVGCGGRKVPERVAVHPVQGQVHYQGRPAAGAYVVFHPKGNTTNVPTPRGHVDAQGNFKLSTYSSDDGAPVGEYAVTVVLEPMVQKDGDYERGKNILPPKYSQPNTTNVVARVAEGDNSVPIKIVR